MKLVVTPDLDNDNPLTWDEGHEFVTVSKPYNYPKNALGVAFDEIVGDYLADDEEITEALIKHYERRGWAAKRLELRGCSQGDWINGVYAYDPKNYGDFSGELEQWFRGDVYTVQLVEVCDCCGIAGKIIDSLSGCYLDDDYTPIDVARNDFDCDIPNNIEVEFAC